MDDDPVHSFQYHTAKISYMNDRSRFNTRRVTSAVLMCLLMVTVSCMAGTDYAQEGDRVNVTYSLSFPDGPVFETNIGKDPFSCILGSGSVIPGFDQAIRGMAGGETKMVILPPSEAYGQYNQSLVRTIPLMEAVEMLDGFSKTNLSLSLLPGYPGPIIEYLPPEGKRERYLFTNITNETVTVDTNKPLAGKTLQFEITLLDFSRV